MDEPILYCGDCLSEMKKITNLVQEFCLLMLKKREILKMIRDKFSENFK